MGARPPSREKRQLKADRCIHVITSLLSPTECEDLVNSHTDLTHHETLYAKRNREVFHDEKFSERVWERIRVFFDGEKVRDDDGEEWEIQGLNDVWRFVRYDTGGVFSPHTDGTRLATVDSQSFMTINIYLNTVAESNGGATRFLQAVNPDSETGRQSTLLAKVQPVQGTAAIFRDDVLHDGEELTDGVKYLLRTDVMYTRVLPFDFERLAGKMESQKEKGEKALEIALGLEEAGNRDEAVKWYKKAFRLCPELDV